MVYRYYRRFRASPANVRPRLKGARSPSVSRGTSGEKKRRNPTVASPSTLQAQFRTSSTKIKKSSRPGRQLEFASLRRLGQDERFHLVDYDLIRRKPRRLFHQHKSQCLVSSERASSRISVRVFPHQRRKGS